MFTAESVLGYDLISKDVQMRSHLEPLGRIAVDDLKKQVSEYSLFCKRTGQRIQFVLIPSMF